MVVTMGAALGFRLHTGWAAVMVWAAGDEPRLLDRRRIELVDDRGAAFVYHRAGELPRADAAGHVQRAQHRARTRAAAALREIVDVVSAQGQRITVAAVATGAARVP